MVEINVEYLGNLHCRITHGPSGQSFLTDAPVDNYGKGEFISHTDFKILSELVKIRPVSGSLIEGIEVVPRFNISEQI